MLDGVASIRGYVDRLVSGDEKCRGMKVLLLDAATTQIVSCVYSQTEILSKEVYLVSRLDDKSNPSLQQPSSTTQSSSSSSSSLSSSSPQSAPSSNGDHSSPMPMSMGGAEHSSSHLKAVCFVRPTDVNIGLLVRELARPRFAEYHVYFSGILPTGLLRLLAENDPHERVRQVQEFYADFVPVNEDLLTLQCRNTLAMTVAAGTTWARDHAHLYDRNLRGLQSMLLALRRQPSVVRYARHSPTAERLARDIRDHIDSDQIFHFRQSNGGGMLLLIIDRKDDPVTPLLSQWTYQAMVHELLGLNNHRVILKGAPNIPKDLEEVVLSANQDEFFQQNRHKNFGELGESIQRLLQDYQKTTQQHSTADLNTIEEMQTFMDKFPELRSRSHVVSKHVAIMGELARLVDVCSLMDVSQFEQELACADDHGAHMRELMDKLQSPSVKIPDKLRLGLLYALRYEHSGNIHRVRSAMSKGGVSADLMELVDVILRYAGAKSRGPGLYGETTLMSKMTKSFITSVQGVSNVYSQHVPLLMETVQSATRGKLRIDTYPVVRPGGGGNRTGGGGGGGIIIGNGGNAASSSSSSSSSRGGMHHPPPESKIPEELLIFMVGGVTYEEATKVSEFNESNQGRIRVILGGSTVHNSTSFLEELRALP